MFRRGSIVQSLAILALAAIVPLLGLIAFNIVSRVRADAEQAEASVVWMAESIAFDRERFVQRIDLMLTQLSERPLIRALDSRNCDPEFADFARLVPQAVNLLTLDADGRLVCSQVAPAAGAARLVDPVYYLAQARHSRVFTVGKPARGFITGRWVVTLAKPIMDHDNQFRGVVALAVDLERFNATMNDKGLPPAADSGLIDSRGTVIATALDPAKWVGQVSGRMNALRGSLAEQNRIAHGEGIDGVERVYAFRQIPGTDWAAFVGVPVEAVYAAGRQHAAIGIAIALGAALLVAILCFGLARRISRPISVIADGAKLAATGNLSARIKCTGPAEVADVANQFNVMLDRQERRRDERIALVNHYRTLIQNARDIILLIDPSGQIVEANDAAATAYGYSADELCEKNIRDLRAAGTEAEFERDWSLGKKPEGGLFESMHKGRDGRDFPVEVSARMIDIEGKLYRQSFIRDISERKQAERELVESEARFRGLVEQAIAGIYIIQEGKFVYVNPRAAEIAGEGATDAVTGTDPLQWIAEADRSVVAESIRQLVDGDRQSVALDFGVLRQDGAVIQVGANAARATYDGRPAIIGLLQDVSEKKRAEEEIRRYVEQLKSAFMSTVKVATVISEMRDPYTAGHERRVADVAVAIGAELGFDAHRQEGLQVAGHLHDIGKITVPAEILSKPGKLSALEFQLVQGHAQAGYDVLKGVEFPWPVAQVALQHHERIDGSGYPQGLKGDAILFEARIMAVADVIEAMSSHRPYRSGLGLDKALAEIERGRGTAYDADAADACLRLFREGRYRLPA